MPRSSASSAASPIPTPRRIDTVRLRVAQFRPRKGRVEENLAALARLAGEAAGETDLLLLPETVTSGYFVEGGVVEVAREAGALVQALGHPEEGSPDLVFGAYERGPDGVLYNSALHLEPRGDRWHLLHLHRKMFLPTYGLFDEARFVKPGLALEAYDTRFGRMGMLICEEMLHSLPPSVLALEGAELLLALSASPAREYRPGGARPASLERWDVAARAITLEHGVHLALAHLVGSEGGRIFAGGSTVYGPGGQVLARGPLFQEGDARVSLSLEAGRRARVRSPMLEDLRAFLPHLAGALARAGRQSPEARGGRLAHGAEGPDGIPGPDGIAGTDGAGPGSSPSHPPAHTPALTPAPRPAPGTPASAREGEGESLAPACPLTPGDLSPLEVEAPLVTEALVSFLRDEVEKRRGFDAVVVGVSGGVDSAVTLALAVRAFGAHRVHAFLLPYATSSPESLEHGHLVCERFGVTPRTIPIAPAVDAYVKEEEPELSPLRRGNLAARFRALVLWDQAAAHRALILGTGNKSERLLGYYTWHADDSPPINPVGDLLKTQVRALARYLKVPEPLIRKPPSADLVEGVHDEDELGVRYEEADLILHGLLEGYSPASLLQAGFGKDAVERVHHLLQSTHWKRRPPTTALLSSSGIGDFYLRPVDY